MARPSGFKTESARATYCQLYDDAVALSPVPVQQSEIETAFGSTHVLTAGDRSKLPLIALHSMGLSSTMWLPLLPTLTATHRVLALDAVGGVNKSVATGVMSSPARVVTWIDEALDALRVGQVALVGSSIGSWMATTYALARPDRVSRLALVSPAGIVGSLRVTWLVTMTLKTQFPPTAAKARWMFEHLVMERTRPQLRTDPWRPIAEQFIFGMPNFRSNLREPRPGMRCDVTALAASGVPVLVLIPRDETGHDGPMMAERYRQRLPQAQVQLVADSNHFMFIDRTDVVTDQLSTFLDAL